MKLLDEHFKVTKCGFAERYKFMSSTRLSSETLADKATRVWELALDYDFLANILELETTKSVCPWHDTWAGTPQIVRHEGFNACEDNRNRGSKTPWATRSSSIHGTTSEKKQRRWKHQASVQQQRHNFEKKVSTVRHANLANVNMIIVAWRDICVRCVCLKCNRIISSVA